jgi:hypothetical protein
MKVQMKVEISGVRDGARWPLKGETIDLPTDEAEALIAAGMAEVLNSAPKVEKRPAAASKVEKRA